MANIMLFIHTQTAEKTDTCTVYKHQHTERIK